MESKESLQTALRTVYVDGAPMQVWDNPDASFGATPEDLRGFRREGSWVALFNAIALSARLEASR